MVSLVIPDDLQRFVDLDHRCLQLRQDRLMGANFLCQGFLVTSNELHVHFLVGEAGELVAEAERVLARGVRRELVRVVLALRGRVDRLTLRPGNVQVYIVMASGYDLHGQQYAATVTQPLHTRFVSILPNHSC